MALTIARVFVLACMITASSGKKREKFSWEERKAGDKKPDDYVPNDPQCKKNPYDIHVKWTNLLEKQADVYFIAEWNGERELMFKVPPGGNFELDCYDNHWFQIFVSGALFEERRVLLTDGGKEQHFNIPLSGKQPIRPQTEIKVHNQGTETVSVYWVNENENLREDYVTEAPGGMVADIQASHGQVLRMYYGDKDARNEHLALEHEMDGTGAWSTPVLVAGRIVVDKPLSDQVFDYLVDCRRSLVGTVQSVLDFGTWLLHGSDDAEQEL